MNKVLKYKENPKKKKTSQLRGVFFIAVTFVPGCPEPRNAARALVSLIEMTAVIDE